MEKLYIYPRSSQEWAFSLCPVPPQWLLNWQGIQQRFSWIQALAKVPQDEIFHAEGDVLTHTRMVTAAMVKLSPWRDLSPEERSLLLASALLHDVGKSSCTKRDENGQIHSRGHMQLSPAQMDAYFHQLMLPGVQAVLQVKEEAL
jgi:hypothetical protein